MQLCVRHTTRYAYPAAVRDSYNELRLMPVSDNNQTCRTFELDIEPKARIFSYELPSGTVHHFNIRAPHNALTIRAYSEVTTHIQDPFVGLQMHEDDSEFYAREGVRQRFYDYLSPTPLVPLTPETDRIAQLARRQAGGPATATFLIALIRLLHRVLEYAPGSTRVDTPIQQVLQQKRGVCQDFAHLMLAICRRQRIPSRYVSGYIYTGSGTKESGWSEEKHLIGGDAMHAWVECLLPDGAWHGFDPTNNLVVNGHYIKVHHGRDYYDVSPIRGVYHGPADHQMETSVRVWLEEES
ncbi:MAG TPA: transglutaminase family protein [Chthonomonas sp.]|jgi:transglutaminase-like putative cysteine protease|uniref:transglutaminase family protein n=1 Tax=Chthonomonas sp. TaxID=2282153 RepID=UPI002B4B76F7|nr:transglutaminase family protein [Chthonomonas sp.]HLH81146.1 transglutaminase family protein [Chthonomonas sp.]